MNDVTTTNGNGRSTPTQKKEQKKSALTLLLEKVVTVKANATDKKAAADVFKKNMGEREKLLEGLKAFDAKADKVAEAMVRCYGAAHVTVDGVRYIPTSRGERVYYKRMSDEQETVEL